MTDEEKKKKFPTVVYSRVCGFLTPIRQWNDSKKSEWTDRKLFNTNKRDAD